jgi:hypothetical protein
MSQQLDATTSPEEDTTETSMDTESLVEKLYRAQKKKKRELSIANREVRLSQGIITPVKNFMSKIITIVTGINRNIKLRGPPTCNKVNTSTNAIFNLNIREVNASVVPNEDNTFDIVLGNHSMNFQDYKKCARNLLAFVVSTLSKLGYLSYEALENSEDS